MSNCVIGRGVNDMRWPHISPQYCPIKEIRPLTQEYLANKHRTVGKCARNCSKCPQAQHKDLLLMGLAEVELMIQYHACLMPSSRYLIEPDLAHVFLVAKLRRLVLSCTHDLMLADGGEGIVLDDDSAMLKHEPQQSKEGSG